MNFFSPKFHVHGWRGMIPRKAYGSIHSWRFRGARRLRLLLGLEPADPELLVSTLVCRFTSPGSVFIDVGAQRGRHVKALFENPVGDVRAVAVEANPDLAAELATAFSSEISANRLLVVHAAAGEEGGTAVFHVNLRDSGYSGLQRRNLPECGPDYETREIGMVTIDQLAAESERTVSCIKIDVEGAEWGVLRGAVKTLESHCPVVLFECANNAAPFYGYGLKELVEWFNQRGYLVSTIAGQEVQIHSADALFKSGICHDFLAFSKDGSTRAFVESRNAANSLLGMKFDLEAKTSPSGLHRHD